MYWLLGISAKARISGMKVAPMFNIFLILIGLFSQFPTVYFAPISTPNQYLWLCDDTEGSTSEMGQNLQEPLKTDWIIRELLCELIGMRLNGR